MTILVSGPTASGKSDLSLLLAARLQGEIINIDSVQWYREAEIGSAKPTRETRQTIPHHLFDELLPSDIADAGLLASRALECVDEVSARGSLPLLVGCSGMYINALYSGLSTLPRADAVVREHLSKRSTVDLYEELCTVDPERAHSLHPHDRQRIERALETFTLTGKPQSAVFKEASRTPSLKGLILVRWPDRDTLALRIKDRTRAMLEAGLIEETAALIQGYGTHAPVLQTIGYAQACEWLLGKCTEAEMEVRINQETRRYAKRQRTFWRQQPHRLGWETKQVRFNGSHPDALEAVSSLEAKGRGSLDALFREGWLPEQVRQFGSQFGSQIGLEAPQRTEVWYLP